MEDIFIKLLEVGENFDWTSLRYILEVLTIRYVVKRLFDHWEKSYSEIADIERKGNKLNEYKFELEMALKREREKREELEKAKKKKKPNRVEELKVSLAKEAAEVEEYAAKINALKKSMGAEDDDKEED